jgi:uncharacterized membrane protein YphA (DoxX/SURF4 family)
MSDSTLPSANPKWMTWTGRVLSALPALMLVMSGVMKLMKSEEVTKGMTHLGYDPDLAMGLGILELTCTLIYAIPQTAALGAILLTGYMGGAIATHVRLGEPFVIQALIGVVIWLGLYLREPRLRALIPWRR